MISIYFNIQNCKVSQCASDKSAVFNCDPKFYVTWFGTDGAGRPLQSAGLAMSRFRQYNIGSLYTSAVNVFNKTITDITNTFTDISTKTNALIDGFKNSIGVR